MFSACKNRLTSICLPVYLFFSEKTRPDIEDVTLGYDEWPFFEEIDRKSCDHVFGDGGVLTTLNDYMIWLNTVAAGNMTLIKSPEVLYTAGTTDDGKSIDYGYGWQIDTLDGHQMIAHSGRWGGHTSFAAIFPKFKMSIAVLSNLRSAQLWRLTKELAEEHLKKQTRTN